MMVFVQDGIGSKRFSKREENMVMQSKVFISYSRKDLAAGRIVVRGTRR